MKIIRIISILGFIMITSVSLSAKDKTVEGELVDVTCFSVGAKGEEHKMCAIACAKNGQPVGIAAKDGKVYTLLTLAPELAEYMTKTLKVMGRYHEASQSIKPTAIYVKYGTKWQKIDLPKTMM